MERRRLFGAIVAPPWPAFDRAPRGVPAELQAVDLAEYVVEREIASAPRQWRNGAEVGEFETTAYL